MFSTIKATHSHIRETVSTPLRGMRIFFTIKTTHSHIKKTVSTPLREMCMFSTIKATHSHIRETVSTPLRGMRIFFTIKTHVKEWLQKIIVFCGCFSIKIKHKRKGNIYAYHFNRKPWKRQIYDM